MYYVREDTTFVQNTQHQCEDTHSRTHTQPTIRQKRKKHLDEVNAKKKKNPTDGNKDKRQSL